MLQSRSFHNHVRVTITFVPRSRKVANIVFPVVIRLKTNSYGLRYVIDIRSRKVSSQCLASLESFITK